MTNHHTHIWTAPDDRGTWTCAECLESSPTCIVQKPSDEPDEGHPTGIPAQHICDGCLRHEQGVLDDIADALGHWQHQPRSLVPAIRYDRDRTTGTRTENNRPAVNTPADIIDVLWDWLDMWVSSRNEQPTESNVLSQLKRYLLWAANNPQTSVWDDYRTEMRQLRHTARRVSGLLPARQTGPCVHCGGTIVRDWATDKWQPRIDIRPEHNGLSDAHRCTGCGLTWGDRDKWMFTNRHTLRLAPEFAPDTLVTIDDARRHIWPDVPASTWRTWRERDEQRGEDGEHRSMPERGRDVRGHALYRVSDLANLVARRADTTRAGRRAG